jgi:hypothetical protein
VANPFGVDREADDRVIDWYRWRRWLHEARDHRDDDRRGTSLDAFSEVFEAR